MTKREILPIIISAAGFFMTFGMILGAILFSSKEYVAVFSTSPSYGNIVVEEPHESNVEQEDPLTTEGVVFVDICEDVPLSAEIQCCVIEMCAKYGVNKSLVYAIMERESGFNENCVSRTGDYGLMQINKVNFSWLIDAGIDPLTTEGNIEAGCKMIGRYIEKYGDIELALMAYNRGEAGARSLWNNGIKTTKYSSAVIELYEKWKAIVDNA